MLGNSKESFGGTGPSQRDQLEQAKGLTRPASHSPSLVENSCATQHDCPGPPGPGVRMHDCHERQSEHQVAYRSTAPMVALRRHRARSQMAGGSVGGLGVHSAVPANRRSR